MSKIFNLLNEKKAINDWGEIGEPYGSTIIDSIPSPDGGMLKKAPSSVPTPFARIDLVNNAFKYVNNSNLEGETVYHRLVSDCFDVAELFFNIDKFGDEIKIKTWNKEAGINELLNSKNSKNKLLGETLSLFLSQDAEHNNFNDMEQIHLLYYNHKIVGGTSPTTLFFSSANDLSFARENLGEDTLFDEKLNPLYKRGDNFLKYLYLIFFSYKELQIKMRYFWEYLTKTLQQLDEYNNTLYNEINLFKSTDRNTLLGKLDNDFNPTNNGVEGGNLFFLGVPLKKLKVANFANTIKEYSELTIKSTKNETKKPLVLQNGLTIPLIYTNQNTKWNQKWEVPYYDNRPLEERILPNQNDRYPYLTVSDFLEPYLVQLPYAINDEAYFNGKVTYESGNKAESYLLPLTQRFFDYFTVEELQRGINGNPMIEMKVYTNSVDVTLRIPIKGNQNCKYITLTRSYKIGNHEPNLEKNKGVVIKNKTSIAIFPFVKQEENPFYRVVLQDADKGQTQHYNYNLNFYSNEGSIHSEKRIRSSKEQELLQTEYYLLENNFDYVIINSNQGSKGVIVPKFSKSTGHSKFKFAVDFGTTNSHIEYSVEGQKAIPFTITPNDVQYKTLYNKDNIIENFICENFDKNLNQQFFPELIGRESKYQFPIRTSVLHNKNFDFAQSLKVLADVNIPFIYERDVINDDSFVATNLKWSDFDIDNSNDKERVKAFIENLILLIRAKVLGNGGNLKNVEITWFYPSSMNIGKLNNLTTIWDELYHKYFNTAKNTKFLSESIAPFYFYKNNRGIAAFDTPAVSVDIGGGTTDIVVFEGENPVLTSSARFAANVIFGDAYGGAPEINGFINKYFNEFLNLLEKNNLSELKSTASQIQNSKKSSDIVSFLFSIEKNEKVKKDIPRLIFSKRLAEDNDLKIVFIVFFASIIYHIAKIMKVKELKAPKNILFSGTGAKTLLIANGGNSSFNNILNKLTSIVFNKVYDTKGIKIEILLENKPKEITCKGGLDYDLSLTTDQINEIKEVLVGDSNNRLVSKTKITFNDISDELLDEVKEEYQNFIELLFSINSEMNFNDYFDISTGKIESYKKILVENTMEFLRQGLNERQNELNNNIGTPLDESLFFYPLIGGLNKLAYEAVTKFKK